MVIHCIVRLVDPINQGKQNNSFLERRRRCYSLVTFEHWVAHCLALFSSLNTIVQSFELLHNEVQIIALVSAALNPED